MPQHAIDTGAVDRVLRPREIADELVRLSRWPSTTDAAADPHRPARDTAPDDEEARLRRLFQRINAAHGVDFTHYKRPSIKRRLERRMALRGIERLDDYAALIDGDQAELEALYHDFLIRVTEFFREPDSFEALRRSIFPVLCEDGASRPSIRIWVPGCATGEEVYSVTIALLEYLGDRRPPSGIQVFGTDVSEAALQKARAGVYGINVLHHVSAERLQRFFTAQDGGYRIAKEVRDLCLFARQDVTRDPPFSRLDLISCRNLLIYLDDVAQRRVLRTFHYALRSEGMLFFGPAESVSQSTGLFERADRHFRVFRRMPNSGGSTGERGTGTGPRALDPAGAGAQVRIEEDSILREADRLLLSRFAPACLLVNQALVIMQFRGDTGRYLRPIGGPPSFDLRRVLRPELIVQVLPAIRESGESGRSSRRAARLDDGGEITIEILVLAGPGGDRSFLILFAADAHPAIGPPVAARSAGPLPESEQDRRIAELQRQAEELRDYVRASIEEHGTVEEELRSAHEEMLSANEEFQSTNEELETSKEELQSTNEELMTTVDELRCRTQELASLNAELDQMRLASDRARAYADVIIETVRQPLAVLDASQRVLRVNPAFSESFEVPREQVEGRFLDDIDGGRWNIPTLRDKLSAFLADNQPLDGWDATIVLASGARRVISISARRIPADVNRAELFLLAFEDVTARANVAAGLLASSARKDQFIAMLGHELRHPLTPIIHSLYLLRQRGNMDPESAELLETIDTQARQLLRYVSELLDLVLIGRDQIEIQMQRLDLVTVVRKTLKTFEPLIEERRHVLSLVLPGDPIHINGDSDRLIQVITNLIENAVKYTDPGGAITVTLEERAAEAVLCVRDSGIGIRPENLERIFEPFTPAHALTGAGSGLGLGLSVVRRLLELHHGQVRVSSGGPGQGSEFLITLPLAEPIQGGAPGPDRHAKAPARPGPTPRRRVLIVDDHEEVGKSIGRLVRAWGHEATIARDGPSALALADVFQPECAIVDISLPGMNGIELARRLREVFPPDKLCMIALTGHSGADMREACLAAGFDEHLVKPGEIALLEELLAAGRAG